MVCLVVYCEWPEISRVKFSLSNSLGGKKAEELYRAFLLDIAEKHSEQEYELYFAFEDKLAEPKFAELLPRKNLYVMKGENLGERIHNIFKDFSISYEKIIVMDSDNPGISASTVNDAISLMKSKDAVVGPTTQGGYYLIGMHKAHKLFTDLEFYKETVLKKTLEQLDEKKLNYALLEKKTIVDSFDTLKKLFEQKDFDECKYTAEFLNKLQKAVLRT
ncbi:MAG: DUF2064 domain-containing protein [Candidatus Diapherotrites archaeon]|nr:DUF2064 domain-containing protein [Candidatus Diapherotrites archaeon]